jgi:RNA-directed DNA polymerase
MSVKLHAQDSVLASSFASLRTSRDVAKLLEVTSKTLVYYLHKKTNYKVFQLKKRSGGTRSIATPATALKIIQRKLNQVLHSVYKGRSPVHGFVRCKSILTNAQRHTDRDLILNFDIEEFFPSIHFGRVKGMFESKPYSLPEPASITLAQICCHNGVLPIGAPTSPIVANMICAQMDSQLKSLAQNFGSTYTRYADDITFSVRHGSFPPMLTYRDPNTNRWVIGTEIEKVVSANGFKINASKTRVLPRGYRQEVTGLVVGRRVNVKRTYIRRVRAMLHACERFGIPAASHHFNTKYDRKQRLEPADFLRVLRGKVEFVGAIRGRDDLIYLAMMGRYLKLDSTARTKPVEVSENAQSDVLERAIWLLEEKDGPRQGTGFAVRDVGVITAAHVLARCMEASCPALKIRGVKTSLVISEDHVDVASLKLDTEPPVRLKLAVANELRKGDSIRVLGFPLHRDGSSVQIQYGHITGESVWHGVPHFVVDCPIVHGNSGGPVLNERNEVVGIAVKGQGIPKRFENDDELSRFVPIDFALQHLRSGPQPSHRGDS